MRKTFYSKDIQQAYTDALGSSEEVKSNSKKSTCINRSFLGNSEQKFNVGLVTSVDYTTAKDKTFES